jgi:demethylmenaquinone methyltransferase/2-methoxy-6-polyprenyl-1,4-benzoquinol methylase
MVLYDFLAPAYDPVLKPLYAPFRRRALEFLKVKEGSSVLDLACGTGQNFPHLHSQVGENGKIVGVDLSGGMLRQSRKTGDRLGCANLSLRQIDATQLSPAFLREQTGEVEVDAVICTYGFSAMRNWEEAFHRSFDLLKPGGTYFIHDIHAERRSWHVAAFELATRVDLSRESWRPLEARCADFHFEYIDPSAYLFAGRLFVAIGTKPKRSLQTDSAAD